MSFGSAGSHHHKPRPLNPDRYSTPSVRTREVKALMVMPYREQWAADILANRSLVECALDVHMTTTGSAERSRDDQNADVKVLADALMKWKQGRPQDERFDNAVREMIGAALAELA